MSERRHTRLLVVGMHNSPHLHRWVRMIANADTTVLVFPSMNFPFEPPQGFRPVRLAEVSDRMEAGIHVLAHEDCTTAKDGAEDRRWGYRPLTHSFVDEKLLASPEALRRCLTRFRPDILHGMETQIAGYICAETARRTGPDFPPWIQSTWGSDIYLYRKLPEHRPRIEEVFGRVRLHLADCERDRILARQFGYRGPDMPILPSSGGMAVDELAPFGTVPPSRRQRIVVKGYHNWAGRALLGLSALMLVKDRLAGFGIDILTASPPARVWAEKMREAGMDIETPDYMGEHRQVLEKLAQARLVIGLGISDGLSTTVLEAMTVGAFPIQSSTGGCEGWIESGRTGFIVSPDDTSEIAASVLRAATDDALVDAAAPANLETVRQRWNVAINARHAWEIYREILPERGTD